MAAAAAPASCLLLDVPLTAFGTLFLELSERDVAVLRTLCKQIQALVDACVQALDTTTLGAYLHRFTRLERLATSLCLKLPEVDDDEPMELLSAPCLRFPVLRDYLPATIVTLSLDCLLAGLDFSCLAALSCLQQLCLRQFPSHHASAMEAVGACTGLLRLRLDSRQATPGLREVQTETLAQLAALQQLRSLDLLCTLFVGPGRTMPADLTDWHFSAIPGHLTRLTHLGLINEALDDAWVDEDDPAMHVEGVEQRMFLGCKFAWLTSLPYLASLHLMGIQKVPKVLQRLQQAAQAAAQETLRTGDRNAGWPTESELAHLAEQRSSALLRLLGDEQPGTWHHPWGYSTQRNSWRQRFQRAQHAPGPAQQQQRSGQAAQQGAQAGQGAHSGPSGQQQQLQPGLHELRLELVYSCGNLSIQRIAANTRLEALSLLFCQLTYHSQALQPLSQLTSLQSLNLGYEHLEELMQDKLPPLPAMSSGLSCLQLAQPVVHASWLQSLSGCPGLVHLLLDCNEVAARPGEDCMAALRAGLKNLARLESLDFPNAEWDSATMLAEVLPKCSELRQLELPLRPDMPINPLPTVEQLSNLGRLSLMSQGSIPQAAADQLTRLAALSKLRHLSLVHEEGPPLPLPSSISLLARLHLLELDRLAAPDFGQLRQLRQLRVLVLRRLRVTNLGGDATLLEQITGAGGPPVGLYGCLSGSGAASSRRGTDGRGDGDGEGDPLPQLRYLALYGAHITEQGVALLARFRRLQYLTLHECTGVKTGHLRELARLAGLRALSLVMPMKSPKLAEQGSEGPVLAPLLRELPALQLLNVVAKGLLPSRVEAALAALPAARQAQLVVTKQVDKELLWCCADKLLAAAAVEEMQAAGR